MNELINRLHLMDCMEYMKGLPDKYFDAVVTDPPWNMNYFSDDNKSWDDYCKWLKIHINEFERIADNIVIFQSSKAIPFVSHLFTDYESMVVIKNFSQMTPQKLPNCYDIVFLKYKNGYKGNGRNWFLSNTAGMLKQRTEHPTPRAEDVMEYILSMFDWHKIYDPFLGSGTTAIACYETGKEFYGTEIEEKYYNIAVERIEKVTAQGKLFAPQYGRKNFT